VSKELKSKLLDALDTLDDHYGYEVEWSQYSDVDHVENIQREILKLNDLRKELEAFPHE
jgi:hypothetical protein